MIEEARSLKFKLTVLASTEVVYSAFTHATALCEWLCNVAQADPRPRGRIYFWWDSGYYASGEYINLKPNEQVVFTWHGHSDPGSTQVKVTLKPIKGGTQLSLVHGGLGNDKAWEPARKTIKKGWQVGLENLKSVLETGLDLRIIRQPVLGITTVKEVLLPVSKRNGRPIEVGLAVEGVVEGTGAHEAGLKGGDIIARISGKRTSSEANLLHILHSKKPDKKVKVVFYRDGKEQSAKVKLSTRSIPPLPDSAEELAETARNLYQTIEKEVQKRLQGLSEEEASYHPQPGTWSVKEILAHLVANERETHSWFASLIEGQESDFSFHADLTSRDEANVLAFPKISILFEELKRNQAETLDLISTLTPEFVARKRSFWQLGLKLFEEPLHYQNHLDQLDHVIHFIRQHRPITLEPNLEEKAASSTKAEDLSVPQLEKPYQTPNQ